MTDTLRRSYLLLALGATICLAGCAVAVDQRWSQLPPLSEMPDTEQDEQLQRLVDDVAQRPNSAEANRALAEALAARGRIDESLAPMAAVLRADPRDERSAAAMLGVGRLLSLHPVLGGLCEGILEDDPDNVGALWVLGELLIEQSQLAMGRERLRRAWHVDPGAWRVALALARVAALQMNSAEARTWSARAEEAAPDEAGAKVELADLYLAAGSVDRALALARAATRLAPDAPETHATLGRALLADRRAAEAVTSLEAALRRAPELPPDAGTPTDPKGQRARWLLGQAYIATGRYEAARDILEDVAKHMWGYGEAPVEVSHDLAMVYQHLGQTDKAIEQYRRAVQGEIGNAAAYNNLAYLYAEKAEHLDEALELARIALERDPSYVTHDTLGWVCYQRGDYASAVTELEAASEQRPDDPTIILHLALAYSRTGRASEGLKLVEGAQRLAAGDPELAQLRQQISDSLVDLRERAKRETR